MIIKARGAIYVVINVEFVVRNRSRMLSCSVGSETTSMKLVIYDGKENVIDLFVQAIMF